MGGVIYSYREEYSPFFSSRLFLSAPSARITFARLIDRRSRICSTIHRGTASSLEWCDSLPHCSGFPGGYSYGQREKERQCGFSKQRPFPSNFNGTIVHHRKPPSIWLGFPNFFLMGRERQCGVSEQFPKLPDSRSN